MLSGLFYILKHEGAFIYPLLITASPFIIILILAIIETISGTVVLT